MSPLRRSAVSANRGRVTEGATTHQGTGSIDSQDPSDFPFFQINRASVRQPHRVHPPRVQRRLRRQRRAHDAGDVPHVRAPPRSRRAEGGEHGVVVVPPAAEALEDYKGVGLGHAASGMHSLAALGLLLACCTFGSLMRAIDQQTVSKVIFGSPPPPRTSSVRSCPAALPRAKYPGSPARRESAAARGQTSLRWGAVRAVSSDDKTI